MGERLGKALANGRLRPLSQAKCVCELDPLRTQRALDLWTLAKNRPLGPRPPRSRMSNAYPTTPAVRVLRDSKIEFDPLLYPYQDKGGTARSSSLLGLDEHTVIKTLVVQGSSRDLYVVLMHGDRQLSLRALSKLLKLKSLSMADPKTVHRVCGYQVGGVSPFGMRQALPLYAQQSIRTLPRIAINGGKRGFLVSLTPDDLDRVLNPRWVEVTQ